MPAQEHDISLRPIQPNDAGYVHALIESTMRVYAERALGAWNDEAVAEQSHRTDFNIIEASGVSIGAIRIERHDDCLRLDQLFIESGWQNRGIGSQLIGQLIAESRELGRPLRLRVLTSNPAQRLYQRLGFVVTQSTPERHYMEYRPTPAGTETKPT